MHSLFNVVASWAEFFGIADKTEKNWLGETFNAISIVMYIIMGLVGAAGAIYAIYLGVQLARAEEQGQRDDKKKHLITVVIAIAVTIVFVLFFNILLPMILSAFELGTQKGPEGVPLMIKSFLHIM